MKDYFSAEAVIHHRIKKLKELGVSDWIIKLAAWRMNRMISKSTVKH